MFLNKSALSQRRRISRGIARGEEVAEKIQKKRRSDHVKEPNSGLSRNFEEKLRPSMGEKGAGARPSRKMRAATEAKPSCIPYPEIKKKQQSEGTSVGQMVTVRCAHGRRRRIAEAYRNPNTFG